MDAQADPNAKRIDEDTDLESRRMDVALGAELRGLRSKRGLTQDQLAAVTGLSKRTIVRIEGGVRPMSIDQLFKIAQALKVKPSVLVDAAEAELGIE